MFQHDHIIKVILNTPQMAENIVDQNTDLSIRDGTGPGKDQQHAPSQGQYC
jgi:hypothetical protein